MRLKVTDQITVSAISAETLRPGKVVVVDDDLGKTLKDRLSGFFQEEPEDAADAKAESAPLNKMEPAPIAPTALTRARRTKAS